MANNRKTTRGRKKDQHYSQVVMSAPSKLFVERYLSPKGKKLLNGRTKLIHQNKAEKAEINAIWAKYGKNRYRINPDAIPCRNKIGGLKIINHT